MRLSDILYEIEMTPAVSEAPLVDKTQKIKDINDRKKAELAARELERKKVLLDQEEEMEKKLLLQQKQKEEMIAKQQANKPTGERLVSAGIGTQTKLSSTSALDQTGLNQKPQPVNKVQTTAPVQAKHNVKKKLGESTMVGLKQMLKDRR